jgi:hypothetical protein
MEKAKLILLKHWATPDCENFVDPSDPRNKIDEANKCIIQFLLNLPRSLHEEAHGTPHEMNEEEKQKLSNYIKAQINDKITIIDMYTIIPKVKENHMTEFQDFAVATGLIDNQFKSIGFILYAGQVKYHQLNDRRIRVLCASTEVNRVFLMQSAALMNP